MNDTSIDRSVPNQEIIYSTFVENGLPVNVMVNIVTLQHVNSHAILSGLHQTGVSEEDLKGKLIGLGCDGASVMIGQRNEVAAKLKAVTIWCVAHCLELTA